MQPFAHCAVIGRCRSPKPDHRHTQLDAYLNHAAMLRQPGLGQPMLRQRLRYLARKADIFTEGGFQQAIHRLLRQLVNDPLRKDLRPGGEPFARARPPLGDQPQRLFRRFPVPTVQPPQHVACIRRCHPGYHHQSARHQPLQRCHLQP